MASRHQPQPLPRTATLLRLVAKGDTESIALPITMALTQVQRLADAGLRTAAEPYVIVIAIDLQTLLPTVEATLYEPASFVWRRPCWGGEGQPKAIQAPADVIFLVTLMTRGDGSAEDAGFIAKSTVLGSLASAIGSNPDRATLVEKLKLELTRALATPAGWPGFDDHVDTRELELTESHLDIEAGAQVATVLLAGGGGEYRVRFELSEG